MGEKLLQEHARVRHGRRDLLRLRQRARPATPPRSTLFLDNSDRTAPAAFNDADELQVTRRIEREAGSVYRINGKEARAKDVQLLFADASTGARSPSMVGPGPHRRADPGQAAGAPRAAGRGGRHFRPAFAPPRGRTAAARRRDRISNGSTTSSRELESQIESLKRQARQANRFKNAFGRHPQRRGDAAASALDAGQERRRPRRNRALSAGDHRWSPNARRRRWRPPRTRRSRACSCRNCARPRPRPPPPCSA